MGARVEMVVVPDVAVKRLTGHVLNFVADLHLWSLLNLGGRGLK